MRHQKHKKVLGRDKAQRRGLVKSLLLSFFTHENIETTEVKAKMIKSEIEKIITLSKKGNLASRRLIIGKIGSPAIADKIITKLAPQYKDRPGGYTRIIKIGQRQGDNARVVYLKLV
jgi:large subunit ribosomal protein L17